MATNILWKNFIVNDRAKFKVEMRALKAKHDLQDAHVAGDTGLPGDMGWEQAEHSLQAWDEMLDAFGTEWRNIKWTELDDLLDEREWGYAKASGLCDLKDHMGRLTAASLLGKQMATRNFRQVLRDVLGDRRR